MSKFCLVVDGVPTEEIKEFDSAPVLEGKPNWVWRPYREDSTPPHTPATQRLGPPVKKLVVGEVVQSYSVIDKTPKEVADEQEASDIAALKGAGDKIVLVLMELIQWQLANTQMTPDDFTQAYLDIKAIADRVK